ncbi:hypothetical protein QEN19_001690 [Hanseniaspora menglaensis]
MRLINTTNGAFKTIAAFFLSFLLLVNTIEAADKKFVPKVTRIDSLSDQNNGKNNSPPSKGGKSKLMRHSNRIVRFDDSHQILALNKDYSIKYSENAGEAWKFSKVPNKVKNWSNFPNGPPKDWEDLENDDTIFVPGYIKADHFYGNTRSFIVPIVNQYEFIMTEDQGSSFTLVSFKKELESNLKMLLNNLGSEFDNFEIEYNWISRIETNSDYKNILVSLSVGLVDKKTSNDDTLYVEFSFISTDKGKSFRYIKPTSKEFSSMDCHFMDKETGNVVSTSDVICYQSSFTKTFDNENSDYYEKDFYFDIKETELIISTDYGKTFKRVPELKDKFVSWFEVKYPYIIVYTAADKFNKYGLQEMFISNDFGKSFSKAVAPGITLPKTDNSWSSIYARVSDDILLLTVSTYQAPEDSDEMEFKSEYYTEMTFISDSTGQKFTAINDVIKLEGNKDIFDGFQSFNQLSNFKGVFTISKFKIILSFSGDENSNPQTTFTTNPDFITFDDGFTWSPFNVKNDDSFECNPETSNTCFFRSLGLQEMIYEGDVSSENFVMTPGIASVKGFISEKNEFKTDIASDTPMTFITRDFGKSWEKIFDYYMSLSYGDYGNIIVGVNGDPNVDGDSQQEFFYSLDQGKTWEEYELAADKDGGLLYWERIEPLVKDGSGYQFIASCFLVNGKSRDTSYQFIIDFSDAFKGQACGESDFEIVQLNGGECIDGKQFSFKKRKLESQCLVRTEYKNLEPEISNCECTEADFECTTNFIKDKDGNCVLDISLVTSSGVCLSGQNVEVPTKKLKNNNSCKNSNKFTIEKQTINCKDLGFSKNNDKVIIHEDISFDSNILKYQYFNTWERDSVLVRTTKGTLYISNNAGESFKKFDQLESDEKIEEVLFNKYHGTYAYILTSKNNLFVTKDAGASFYKNKEAIPSDTVQLLFPIDVNIKNPNKLIYYGGANCESIFNSDCHSQAYISENGGRSFEKLLENAVHCEFSGAAFAHANENLIICEVKEKGSPLTTIVSSTDYFKNDKKVIFDKSSVGFVSYKDFTVIANVEKEGLKGYITMDGLEFAKVKLPKLFADVDQKSFTIAGSTSGSIIMHLTTESSTGKEYGALLKSNSNGTSFVTIERAVNRNGKGFVDFEYVGDLEGVFITNVVTNTGAESKKLKTKISFNDGASFRYLTPPNKNFDGNNYDCTGKDIEKCSLNLHSYTDRSDFRDSLSSGAGVGLLVGIGSVGETLMPYEQCSTFLSTDGGISWKEISRKPYQYEFGDRGNIIVLASNEKADSILYSIDQGSSWKTFKIADEPILIKDIVTNPTDSSLKFLIISTDFTISLNFAELFNRQCSFESSNDFEYKPLLHPDSKCIFGHEIEYIHKTNNECFVGMAPLKDKYRITKNCTCTRDDYECDYNYELSTNGVCKLVEGLSPLDPLETCAKNPDLIEVFYPTGYRKNDLSTCKGGKLLDIPSSMPKACPGKEDEFKKLHSLSSGSTLFFFMLSMAAMFFTLWIVYERGIKRNGGFARFGEIRLRDENDADDIIEENFGDIIINRIVSFGVLGFYGLFNIYNKVGKPSGKILNKFAHIIGLRRNGFRNQDYSTVPTGNRFNTFTNDSENEDNSNGNEDLFFGNDEDANNLTAFADEDINFDIDEHINGVDTPFLPYNDEDLNNASEEPDLHRNDDTDED